MPGSGRRGMPRPYIPTSRRQASVCSPSSGDRDAVVEPNCAAPSASVATGPYADVLVAEVLEPVGQAARHEDRGELDRERILVLVVLPVGELGRADELAEAPEELRLERPDREEATGGGPVDPVAGEAAREHSRNRLTAPPMRDEVMRTMSHRDDESRALGGPFPGQERRQDFGDGAERARCKVGDLNRRQHWSRVLEDAGPAEVVHVVSRACTMRAFVAETRDRAVDDRVRNVARADPDALGDAGPEALQHDVCPRAQRPSERRVGSQVADDGLGSGAERGVPGGRRRPHRVTLRRLHPHDASAQPQELSACVGAGEVAREVDDEDACERLPRILHWGGAYLYPQAVD